MKGIVPLLLLVLSACTFTVAKTPPSSYRYASSSSHGKAKSPSTSKAKTALVDSQWLERYKALESEYNYGIPADEQITAEGSKFRVPQAVIDHYMDIIKAKKER